MWTIEKECIMNTKPFGPGYGKMVGIATFLYTIIFTFCLGYTKKDMHDTHCGNNGNLLEQNVDQNNNSLTKIYSAFSTKFCLR